MKNKELLSTREAANYIGVSMSTVYRMVENKTLNPSKTPGGHRRFSIKMLDEFKKNSKEIKAPQDPSSYKNPENLGRENRVESKKEVDKRNKLNDLTGTEWLPATKSYFYQKGLGASHPHAKIERQHPAPFSFQDIESLILFFTKKGMQVLDPFGGVGSTAKACALNERVCTSIELQQKWSDLAIERLETEVGPSSSSNHKFIVGDSREVLKTLDTNSMDFMVTSPPYWMILNKKADHKVKKERVENNLATNYSEDDESDIANITSYEDFLGILVDDFFMECARIIKEKKYMCLVVSDFRHKSDYFSFHSDLIHMLNKRKIVGGGTLKLQGTKILIQNHKSLLPYGYPFAYVENIHHQYVLIFRKD
ncbi:DNA methyltransferase [Aliidiomarina quisquiliarum]|uniref:DNA methyltransferase n=1 Tax=Aliidiomarina quisquiliarum TaxID=2938947 RepID=UPI00208E0729|nr:DNA methyltransferase [Aliidiomarina quisquiliarum]MCO4320971.1 excisionase family DNA-binding protein [Aliidiomarina quisquiliarum]